MTVGDLSKKYGVNREAVRFYERKGLLPRPTRNMSGYRLYDAQGEKALSFILSAKNLGFTLAEIKSLLQIRVVNQGNCEKIRTHAKQKINEIDAKIIYLQRLKKSLSKLVTSCIKNQTTTYCPILENMEN
jgi:DNA-binding transcriptional MerR regulator